MKKIIKINESQIRQIIKESVNNYLNEWYDNLSVDPFVWNDEVERRTRLNIERREEFLEHIDDTLKSLDIDPNSIEEKDKEMISILMAKRVLNDDNIKYYINVLFKKRGITPGVLLSILRKDLVSPLALMYTIQQNKHKYGSIYSKNKKLFKHHALYIEHIIRSGCDYKTEFGYVPKGWKSNGFPYREKDLMKREMNESARVIYGYEGEPIGEETDDGKINWYYSDGSAGGTKGGHFMDTYEFLRFNGLDTEDDYDE